MGNDLKITLQSYLQINELMKLKEEISLRERLRFEQIGRADRKEKI